MTHEWAVEFNVSPNEWTIIRVKAETHVEAIDKAAESLGVDVNQFVSIV